MTEFEQFVATHFTQGEADTLEENGVNGAIEDMTGKVDNEHHKLYWDSKYPNRFKKYGE